MSKSKDNGILGTKELKMENACPNLKGAGRTENI